MERRTAEVLWSTLCTEALGVDSNGQEVVKVLPLGYAAMARGLPSWGSLNTTPGNRKAVADFLKEWAAALESVE